MSIHVTFTDDPARVLLEAGKFLTADPVRNNLVLTLLHGRVSHPEPGRYWMAKRGGEVAGIVFQSPLSYPALVAPMERDAVTALVDAIAKVDVSLPGVSGDAATAAGFAGQWIEVTNSAAVPTQGFRIYEAATSTGGDALALSPDLSRIPMESGPVSKGAALGLARGQSSHAYLRQAVPTDRDLLVEWMRGFMADVHDDHGDPEQVVERRLPAGQFWLWDDNGPVSMAANSLPVSGVVRIGPVYTPPEHRSRGYASACTAALTAQILAAGHRCILYTDLANPTSNSIYRRIGYRAVEEALRYTFKAKLG